MKTVAVIEGGHSHEEVISKKSAQTILKNIDRGVFDVVRVLINKEGWFALIDEDSIAINIHDFSFVLEGKKKIIDFAFIMIHGTPGEDGKLQGYFDLINIPYNTPSQLVSALTFNKYMCNQLLEHYGFNVAKAQLVRKKETIDAAETIKKLGLPCFVKPTDGGSSFGITKVTAIDQLDEAIKEGMKHGTEVVIESFLKGRELTNGIYRNKKGFQSLPITEIITTNDFFDFDAKYKGESNEITPAKISDELTKEVKEITKKVAEVLDLRGISRVDYIIVENRPYIIEVNTIPGMSEQSLIPQMAALENISLSQLITEVIDECSL